VRTLTANAQEVLEHRYLRRDAAGRVVESPAGMVERVAQAVAEAERPAARAAWRERFREAMADLAFLPNSPTLMNAGTEVGQLSACFVLPLGPTPDDVERTLDAVGRIQATGGGTGFSLSSLAPAEDGGPHPIEVVRRIDALTKASCAGGKRRGANMGVLAADHPDVLAFVRAKRDDGMETFNLSLAVTDAFFAAVDRGEPWALRDPVTGRVRGRIGARDLFDEVVRAAWAVGDPGLVFLDRVAEGNPVPHLGRIVATNPCG
jgi:ribonucleoside-diphosphate reductase alpha chain